jgi:hypothetical protein
VRRMQVRHESPSLCSSHFLRRSRHVQHPPLLAIWERGKSIALRFGEGRVLLLLEDVSGSGAIKEVGRDMGETLDDDDGGVGLALTDFVVRRDRAM